MTDKEMLKWGGIVLGKVGLQQRPVIKFHGEVYEKAIHFDDGFSHDEMYRCSPQHAKHLVELLS